MKCKGCGKSLTEEEIQTNLCYECGEIINQELFNKDAENVSQESSRPLQNNNTYKTETTDYEHSSYDVAGTINTYITIISVLALIGGLVLASKLESFSAFLYVAIATSILYCFFRMLTLIAYLLADIKENTTPNNQRKNKKR